MPAFVRHFSKCHLTPDRSRFQGTIISIARKSSPRWNDALLSRPRWSCSFRSRSMFVQTEFRLDSLPESAGGIRSTSGSRLLYVCAGFAAPRSGPSRIRLCLPRDQRPTCDLAHWNSVPPWCSVLPLVVRELLDAGAVKAHHENLAVWLRRVRVRCFILEAHP